MHKMHRIPNQYLKELFQMHSVVIFKKLRSVIQVECEKWVSNLSLAPIGIKKMKMVDLSTKAFI